MAIQSSVFTFIIGHFFVEKKNKLGFRAWFSRVSAEGTTEKENKKKNRINQQQLAGIHSSFLHSQEDFWS